MNILALHMVRYLPLLFILVIISFIFISTRFRLFVYILLVSANLSDPKLSHRLEFLFLSRREANPFRWCKLKTSNSSRWLSALKLWVFVGRFFTAEAPECMSLLSCEELKLVFCTFTGCGGVNKNWEELVSPLRTEAL